MDSIYFLGAEKRHHNFEIYVNERYFSVFRKSCETKAKKRSTRDMNKSQNG